MDNIDMNQIQLWVQDYGMRILAAAIIFIVGKWLANVISNLVTKALTKANVDSTLVKFLKNIIYAALLVFVIIAALNKLGVSTASAVAVLGAAGLAIALSLQSSLSNFAAGVMMIIFKPFVVGDFIKAGDVLGKVEEIHIFHCVLRGPDNVIVVTPNSNIMQNTITNFTNTETRRVDLVFGISYDDDIKKAKEILLTIAKNHPKTLDTPEPLVAVDSLGDSSVNLICRPWSTPADYWDVYRGLLEQGKEELEKAGITIPFPQRDVHLYNEK